MAGVKARRGIRDSRRPVRHEVTRLRPTPASLHFYRSRHKSLLKCPAAETEESSGRGAERLAGGEGGGLAAHPAGGSVAAGDFLGEQNDLPRPFASRAAALKRDLVACLRTGRALRIPRPGAGPCARS